MKPDEKLQRALLGELIEQPDMAGELPFRLREEMFESGTYRSLYKAIMTLQQEGRTVDVVTLFGDRVRLGIEMLTASELVEIANAGYGGSHFVTHANMLLDRYKHMVLAEIGRGLQETGEASADEMIEQLEDRLYGLTEQTINGYPLQIGEELDEVVARIHEASKTGRAILGIRSGFRRLDYLTTGFKPDTLTIVAARPAQGKSALALTIARHVAEEQIGVGIFSLEMGRDQLLERLLMQDSGIEGEKIRTGILNRQEMDRLDSSRMHLRELPIYIDDTAGLSTMQLRMKVRKLVRKQGVKLVVVDYLQLLTTQVNNTASRENEVAKISRSLKTLAQELHIPIIALSQLNREMERGAEVREPRLSDLRESGAIEQDADMVLMLHDSPHKQWPDERLLILAKQRSGATGHILVRFHAQTANFSDGNERRGHGEENEPELFGGT